MTNREYDRLVQKHSHKSHTVKDCTMAFLTGGAICAAGQGLMDFFIRRGISKDQAGTLVSVTLIFVGVLLTFLGVYDNIAKHAGAGTLVPITGFANSICAPAIEFKSEGLITGLGVKMFVIAGPVLVYGISSSILCGIVLELLGLFGIKPL